MAASLRALVSALEDDPYCGTRPPHWPGGPLRLGSIEEIIANRFDAVELNPQPLPPIARNARAVAFQQVRLYQLGQSLQASGGPAASAALVAGRDLADRLATQPRGAHGRRRRRRGAARGRRHAQAADRGVAG